MGEGDGDVGEDGGGVGEDRGDDDGPRQRSGATGSKGENLSSLSVAPSAIGRGIIAVVIVFINITILISFTRSTLPHPALMPYLNIVLYATYYDPMMFV